MALPISTPFNGMEEARILPNVLPPATSLWFTKRWHGTPAASQMLAKMAADTASLAYFWAALNLMMEKKLYNRSFLKDGRKSSGISWKSGVPTGDIGIQY